MTAKNFYPGPPTSLTEVATVERIVDYSFEKNEKSNVLAIHPMRPLIAYLISIQRTPKTSKSWLTNNDVVKLSPSSSMNGNQIQIDQNKTVSIRILDYVTRQRCLAKGVYHARPVDCQFIYNSLVCSKADIIKLAVVDKLSNIYLYDLKYSIHDELTATRIAVIRCPPHEETPGEWLNLVWCPFVPCEDFKDGDGGLRLALSADSKIEIFAVDRLHGRTGELQRNDLQDAAYRCIQDASKADIVTLSISPDCSTLATASLDNRVRFFSINMEDGGQRCLHCWEANMINRPISRLFFLDDYPKLLEDDTMQFWGAAFIGTRDGQILLLNLKTWNVYQRVQLTSELPGVKNFDYRIDPTARNIVAINNVECFIIQIDHDHSSTSAHSSAPSESGSNPKHNVNLLDSSENDAINGNIYQYLLSKTHTSAKSANRKPTPKRGMIMTANNSNMSGKGLSRIVKTSRLIVHTPIYSFVIINKSPYELELFTISAYSLDQYIINLEQLSARTKLEEASPILQPTKTEHLSSKANTQTSQKVDARSLLEGAASASPASTTAVAGAAGSRQITVDCNQVDKLVETLFTKLNTSFSQGLDEFLSEVKCEVNDLKLKLNGLCKDVSKLQQQLHDIRQK